MKCGILLYLLLLTSCLSLAQGKVQMDSGSLNTRSFNQESLRTLKNDRKFRYEEVNEPPKSLWDRFWSWFWFKVSQLLSTRSGRNTVWTSFAIVAIAIIVYFVIKVTGMNKSGLFGRSNRQGINFAVSSDDIHRISFQEAIEEAVADGNYRLATRYLYLQSLKILSDREYINWQVNKTNTDYLHEINDKDWAPAFQSLTHSFEYAWYGEIPVSKGAFSILRQQFSEFNTRL